MRAKEKTRMIPILPGKWRWSIGRIEQGMRFAYDCTMSGEYATRMD